MTLLEVGFETESENFFAQTVDGLLLPVGFGQHTVFVRGSGVVVRESGGALFGSGDAVRELGGGLFRSGGGLCEAVNEFDGIPLPLGEVAAKRRVRVASLCKY